MPTAVEKISAGQPVHNFRRTVTRDIEMRGGPIKAGDKVVIGYVSANRDGVRRPLPFDIARPRTTT